MFTFIRLKGSTCQLLRHFHISFLASARQDRDSENIESKLYTKQQKILYSHYYKYKFIFPQPPCFVDSTVAQLAPGKINGEWDEEVYICFESNFFRCTVSVTH